MSARELRREIQRLAVVTQRANVRCTNGQQGNSQSFAAPLPSPQEDPAPTPAPQVQTLRRPGPHTREKAAVPDGSGRGWRAAAYTDQTERPFAVGDGDESSMWTPLNYRSARDATARTERWPHQSFAGASQAPVRLNLAPVRHSGSFEQWMGVPSVWLGYTPTRCRFSRSPARREALGRSHTTDG
jgi:hypothetical protein